MKCPVCTGVELKIAERQGIEIDYCPDCRGVWLDRGELDKIIERSATQQQPAYAPPPAQPAYQPQHNQQTYQHNYDRHHDKHHDKHGYGHHGRKSWLAELFD